MHKTQFFKIYKRCVICNQRIYFSFSQSELNKIFGFPFKSNSLLYCWCVQTWILGRLNKLLVWKIGILLHFRWHQCSLSKNFLLGRLNFEFLLFDNLKLLEALQMNNHIMFVNCACCLISCWNSYSFCAYEIIIFIWNFVQYSWRSLWHCWNNIF